MAPINYPTSWKEGWEASHLRTPSQRFKYIFAAVLPDVPWYAHDIPQTEFGEGEVFPSANLEKLITAQTSMAEIKRLFESVEQMSVRSDESTDESEGPRAWYKPQQDETLHDERSKLENDSFKLEKSVGVVKCKMTKLDFRGMLNAFVGKMHRACSLPYRTSVHHPNRA